MSKQQARTRPISRQAALIAAAVLVTALALALAFYARWRAPHLSSLSWQDLTGFEFNAYIIGYLFQGIVLPAVLIYLLSTTQLFRRYVGDKKQPRDGLRLFLALALIQVVVQSFDLWRVLAGGEPGPLVLGLLVVVTGGLLGGWPMGLAVGLVAMLFRGTQEFVMGPAPHVLAEMSMILEREGLLDILTWPGWVVAILDAYILNFWASAAVWAGCLAGLLGELLGDRRWTPLAAFLMGAGFDLGAGFLSTVAGGPPGVVFLIPSLLVSGVALSAVALMVRSVQADIARRRTEAAELALARAELRALRAQINPHFLFNALNTIRFFVRTDPEAARRLLLYLSEVFQRALRSGEFVPLRDELSYVEAYLALEQARLGERLRVEWLPHPDVEAIRQSALGDQQVPTLILQPIVENAVVHGIAQTPGGGIVRVSASQRDGYLFLQVADTGPGIPPQRLAEILGPERAETRSIGLRNVDGRLRALYGDDHGLVIKSAPDKGTRVGLRIPGA
jgi:LytS/YehU family sensor histidine kinase